MIAITTHEERGAALVILGNALCMLGQRENGVRRLLEAVEVTARRSKLTFIAHSKWQPYRTTSATRSARSGNASVAQSG